MSDGGPAPMEENAIEATQMDRQMAAYIGKRFAHWTEQQVRITLEGRGDKYPIVQAFARHRTFAMNEHGTNGRSSDGHSDSADSGGSQNSAK